MRFPGGPEDITDMPEAAVTLAAELLTASRAHETGGDRANSSRMARMMKDLPGKKFTIAMVDQVLRIPNASRAAGRLGALLSEYGVPRYLSAMDRILMWMGSHVANLVPGFVMPLIKKKVRNDSDHVIISAEPGPFARYLERRRKDDIRINFNQLGEAVLGDDEANRRLQMYLDRLAEPEIRYVSVKLSSVVSQISLTGYQATLTEVTEALRRIYRAAMAGPGDPCFVNLDMEEYRDLHLTVDAFQTVLNEPEFEKLEAGIVLQAYLPDSFAVLKTLTDWSRERFGRTGARIKVRIVKGANLAMEQVEASLEDWPLATYHSKRESDANYKRMLEYACRPEHAESVRVGIASHNLFDIAYALLLRKRRGVEASTEFEMLEGMANAQALEIRERSGDLVIYTPACFDAEFESAVAYLVRRFDENTQEGSFLGALFDLREGTQQWEEQKAAFLDACRLAFDPELPATPHRTQNRLTETPPDFEANRGFHNAPNTDFSIPANREWIRDVAERWSQHEPETIPIQVAGEIRTTEWLRDGTDPSRPGVVAYQFSRGDAHDVDLALQTATRFQPEWEAIGIEGRARILFQVASLFARERGNTIGAMMLDGGKAAVEADVEVTEAIDFANYYARSLSDTGWSDGAALKAAGVVVVTPPWNFPYAIPAGGILAGLMAGNTVILKPASETVFTAWQLAKQMWEAGVPKEALQFLPLKDGETGKALISDPRVNIVILTGGYSTAQLFQSWRPDLRLYAETSGKNSMIITASADLDLAVKYLVRGAFGHSGQKCSATSLALVQREVYESEKFRHQLRDAAQSLKVAGSWDLSAAVTPVIRKPSDELEQGLCQLDAGESWLLEPRMVDDNPCLWSPGIRLGVQPQSWYHRTECFGPVLGLICVDSFEEALEIQNSSEFGLTGGLHSMDPGEIRKWRDEVQVGNAYINRTTTGAIVRRQPFGGWKNSCVGPGAKAGGPNYVASMGDWETTGLPVELSPVSADLQALVNNVVECFDDSSQRDAVRAAVGSYQYWWNLEFSVEHDPSALHGETNHFRYRPRGFHGIRLDDVTGLNVDEIRQDIVLASMGCRICGVPFLLSSNESAPWIEALRDRLASPSWEWHVEDTSSAAARLAKRTNGSVRLVGTSDPKAFAPAVIGNHAVIRGRVLLNGRVELLNYLREQSMTQIVHRYGNIV